jgi:hypothetical protein
LSALQLFSLSAIGLSDLSAKSINIVIPTMLMAGSGPSHSLKRVMWFFPFLQHALFVSIIDAALPTANELMC